MVGHDSAAEFKYCSVFYFTLCLHSRDCSLAPTNRLIYCSACLLACQSVSQAVMSVGCSLAITFCQGLRAVADADDAVNTHPPLFVASPVFLLIEQPPFFPRSSSASIPSGESEREIKVEEECFQFPTCPTCPTVDSV